MNNHSIRLKIINQKSYFEKKYEHKHRLNKVLTIHRLLEEIDFKHILPIRFSTDTELYQEWYHHFRHANFKAKEDRLQIFQVIRALHETKNAISWRNYDVIPLYSLSKKWATRIEKFERAQVNIPQDFLPHYEKWLHRAKIIFNNLGDRDRLRNLTLCHGDLAHHNFMNVHNEWKLIDFDLAFIGSEEEELISWIQRLLPFVDYQLLQLLEEMPELEKIGPKLTWLAFPNEELREILHYCVMDEKERKHFTPFLQQFLVKADSRQEFLHQQIQSVL